MGIFEKLYGLGDPSYGIFLMRITVYICTTREKKAPNIAPGSLRLIIIFMEMLRPIWCPYA